MSVPSWSAARSGLLGDTGAVDASAQVNQLLGTHAAGEVYRGNSILTPFGTGSMAWQYHLDAYDIDQPFTLSGTSVGRVAVPLLPVGAGADLIVSLCADSSGNPGAVITQTRIPANWVTQLAAVSGVPGPSSQNPTVQSTGNPLALAQFNTLHMGPVGGVFWSAPTNGTGGPVSQPVSTYYGDYLIQLGGSNGSTFYNNVYTIGYDENGNLAQAVPQPALPANTDGTGSAVVQTDPGDGTTTLVMTGGAQVSGGGPVAAVFAATFDTATGVIGSWSSQNALPAATQNHSASAWGGYVYVLGGSTASGTTANVYYAQVQNGQLGSWTATTPLPLPLWAFFTVAINGFLFVIGGENSAVVAQSTVYYAPINADGTLGTWQAGPPLPTTMYVLQGQPALRASTYGIVINGSSRLCVLGVGADGPDAAWQSANLGSGGFFYALSSGQDGSWRYYGLYGTLYNSTPLALTPRISVPLPASGLTNGATYHLLLRQAGGSENDYLRTHDDVDVFSGNPTLLTRAAGSATWVAGTSGHAVPVQVFDNSNGTSTPGDANNQVWHTWEDDGARITTLARATTPDRRMLGICEATAQPGPVLNSNPVFTAGTAPWTATNGTLTQSSAQTHGSLPYSGLLTPTGGNPDAYIQSEYLACTPGPGSSYTVTAWVYSPTGWSAVFPNLNFYDASKTFVSSGTGSFNVPAATWTQITATYPVPDTALYLTIDIGESSTPAATNLLYVSAATVQDASGPQVSSVAQVTYAGTWPGTGLWPPTGVSVLA